MVKSKGRKQQRTNRKIKESFIWEMIEIKRTSSVSVWKLCSQNFLIKQFQSYFCIPGKLLVSCIFLTSYLCLKVWFLYQFCFVFISLTCFAIFYLYMQNNHAIHLKFIQPKIEGKLDILLWLFKIQWYTTIRLIKKHEKKQNIDAQFIS